MQIVELRANHIVEPIGFCMEPLSLSWKMADMQEEDRIQWVRVSICKKGEIIYDSGELEQADGIDFAVDIELESRTRYDWSVAVKTEGGSCERAESFFETGKGKEPWQAQWITPEMTGAVIMERAFLLERMPENARCYMCGLGVYEFYLNGKKVSDEYLAPGYHSYDLHLQTQTYDVTPYLQEGENRIEVMLADGWFRGRLGFDGGYRDVYGDKLYLIQEIHLVYADGTDEWIGSDAVYQCRRSPIVKSDIYDGEIYDARLEKNKERSRVLLLTPENCGALEDRYSLPVKAQERMEAVELLVSPKGEKILDFGQNLTGWVEFESKLPQGVQITLTAAEILQDGCFYHDNYRTAKAEFTYISDGEERVVRPHFTFYGFRYMKVETTEEICRESFRAVHLRSDFRQTGIIDTGRANVNQLFSNALWSQKDNSLDVPTDCAQRDERLGWTGDAQVFSDTACFNMDMAAFYRKYLWDMRAEQEQLNGSVPNVVPRLKKPMIEEHGACPWADAGVIIPWNLYLHYGSRTLLGETYPGMKAWVDYQKRQEEAKGGKHLIKEGFHFGDWLALDHDDPTPFGATDPLYIASCYYMRDAQIVAKAAHILGKEEASQYESLAKEIRTAILEVYFDEKGLCRIPTQTAAALAIMFELNPDKKKEEGAALAARVRENNSKLNTGFVGTPLLCAALSETGHHELAVTLLLNEECPGWLYAVKLGATTIWERWNSVLEDGHMNPEGMNSLNHYSYGSIIAWMYRYVCGICGQEEASGYRSFLLRPYTDPRLGKASGVLETVSGRIESRWSYEENGKRMFEFVVPFGTTARLILPENGIFELREGNPVKNAENQYLLKAGHYCYIEK